MVPKLALSENTKLTDAIQHDYPKILRWARKITKDDHDAAEDLVQDLAVKSLQMTVTTSEVTNVESYLYRSLINAHITKCRKKTRRRESQIDDEDLSGERQLITDPRLALSIREELAEICHFASVRKDSSISASILLLRFFHGYYTAEVVKLLKRPRNSIESRLAKARRELEQSLHPIKRTVKGQNVQPNQGRGLGARPGDNFLQELRRYIFSVRTGDCLTREQYRKIYTKRDLKPSREEIAHLVSCENCLESVNALLKIPSLRERDPLDTRGPESASDLFHHHRTRNAMRFSISTNGEVPERFEAST